MGVSFIFAFKIEYHCYGFSCIDIKTKLTENFIQKVSAFWRSFAELKNISMSSAYADLLFLKFLCNHVIFGSILLHQ